VLEEVDRRTRELAADLKSGRGIAVAALLKEVHDALRGLRSEVDMPADSAWGKQLTHLRAEVSKILSGEIELMPGRVRRLIRPRPSREIVAGTFNELQQLLDTGTRTLLDALRGASSGERPFRQSQVDAAVRFCAQVFGKEYASLLAKAAEVASHDHERKAAVAAKA
jgi:hypothetical protein